MKELKKLILAVVMIVGLLLPCQMKAQVFLNDEDEYSPRAPVEGWDGGGLVVPNDGNDVDVYVPLGSGFLALMSLGGAYLLAKRRDDHEGGN